jgi:hypothetical protein
MNIKIGDKVFNNKRPEKIGIVQEINLLGTEAYVKWPTIGLQNSKTISIRFPQGWVRIKQLSKKE